MLKDELNIYEPSLDPELAENGETLGINLIANVVTPAVKIKGVAFTSNSSKSLKFKDDVKMRIAAPILVPDDIYRNDSDEQYYWRFTPENILEIAKDFMSRLSTKGGDLFILEHDKNVKVDSFILEAIAVDSDSKIRMIKEDYGIDVPYGTFFVVQQFTDRAVYDDIVKRGATSFSIEGFLGSELVKEYQFKENKRVNKLKLSKMSKRKKLIGTKRVLMSASKRAKFNEVTETEELIIIADEFEEGSEVVIVEDVEVGAVEDFTGEIDVELDGEDKVIIVESGTISEIVEEDDEEVEDQKEVEMEKDEKEKEIEAEKDEKEKEVKAEDEEVEVETVEDTNDELAEIYTILADIKAELAELKAGMMKKEEVEDVEGMIEQKFHSALSAFNTFNSKK